VPLLAALAQTPVLAETVPAASAVRGVVATVMVLGLLAGLAWLLRRGSIGLPGRRASGPIRVETAVPLGERRSLVVVSVDDRRLLLGLTPTQIALVTELASPPADGARAAAEFDRTLAGRLDAAPREGRA
jgi:flagellar protein FliO/FliZ